MHFEIFIFFFFYFVLIYLLHAHLQKCIYLNTWFVQTITGCWFESWLSLTCSTTCTHIKSPSLCCIWTKSMQDRSCSDCVTTKKKEKRKTNLKTFNFWVFSFWFHFLGSSLLFMSFVKKKNQTNKKKIIKFYLKFI